MLFRPLLSLESELVYCLQGRCVPILVGSNKLPWCMCRRILLRRGILRLHELPSRVLCSNHWLWCMHELCLWHFLGLHRFDILRWVMQRRTVCCCGVQCLQHVLSRSFFCFQSRLLYRLFSWVLSSQLRLLFVHCLWRGSVLGSIRVNFVDM